MSTISRLYEFNDVLPLKIVGSRVEELFFDITWEENANLIKNRMQLRLSAETNTASGDHVSIYINNVLLVAIRYHAFENGKSKYTQPYFIPVKGKNVIRIVRTPAYDWVQNSELLVTECSVFALWDPEDGVEVPEAGVTKKPKGTVTKITESFTDEYGKLLVMGGIALFLWVMFDRLVLRKASGGWTFGDRVKDYFINDKNAP